MRLRYSPEQLDFIRAAYATMPISDLAPAFNARFGTDATAKKLRSTIKNHKITCGRKPKERIKPCRLYTKEQAAFLTENYTGRSVADLTAVFNDRFHLDRTQQQIKTFVHNRGITSGRTGRFEKGQTPWNLRKKGYMGANVTSFKKGNIPHTKKRLWSERINRDGFIEISIPARNPWTGAPTRYRHKHVWLWETEHGPVPKGHAVAFIDSDKLNCVLENLMLVTRPELLSMNLHGYREASPELKPTILALARMEAKAGIRTRPGVGRGPRGG
jgi:hypothetical protein